MITAPWTPEQVAALNAYQQRDDRHPYTCSNGHVLVATRKGWECPSCDYRARAAWLDHTEDLLAARVALLEETLRKVVGYAPCVLRDDVAAALAGEEVKP